ncbi:glycosyltransferase family 8 protein [Polychaeton citri CBS 116435]|uniref:Glycosyltransferase family 8 protein n=1 Tax=Polychaeton citri CBS 116435 TaxID=1314669 RepID=A0A9P4Q5V4_9PEZI|nr:glycosyltransferase family 8 protein [Polychaeton citri CBS 116435]
MPAGNYWEDDELEDRLYHLREREKHGSHNPRTDYMLWPFQRRRRAFLLFVGIFVLWWYFTSGSERPVKVDWSRFAYSQYATDTHSMCNAFMVFEALHRLGSKADRVLLYPQEWVGASPRYDRNAQLMHFAQKKYNVKLEPIQLLGADGKATPGTLDEPSDWDVSVTKLRAFDLVQYDRVLHLDSDIVLQQHMDELFMLPKTQVAMPRAYWSKDGNGPALTSLIMLLEPNPREVQAMMETLRHWRMQPDYSNHKKYDMDLLNYRFDKSAMVLPHRPYAMLSSEFRNSDHSVYLGTVNAHNLDPRTRWDPKKALKEAKLIHFSDWPLPKPWVMWPIEGLREIQPDCGGAKTGSCVDREIWKGLYDDFRKRRKDLCRILSVPAPDNWWLWKNETGYVQAVSGPRGG